MEEEWNWKVRSTAELRDSVDDKMAEEIGMGEVKNEKVRGREEKKISKSVEGNGDGERRVLSKK